MRGCVALRYVALCDDGTYLSSSKLVVLLPLTLHDVIYYTLNEVAEKVGRRRETIWRWITSKKVPEGRRYRDKELLFTESELEQIYAYAHRLAPIGASDPDQLRLFTQPGESA